MSQEQTKEKEAEQCHDNPGLDLNGESKGQIHHQSKEKLSTTDEQVVLIHTEDELFEDLPEPENSGSLCGNGPLARFGNLCGNWVALQSKVGRLRKEYHSLEVKIIYAIAAILYNAYFIYAIVFYANSENPSSDIGWCNGLGLLILITAVVYASLIYKHVLCRAIIWFLSTQAGKKFRKQIIEPVSTGIDWFFSLRLSSAIIYFVVCVAFAIFLIIDTADDRRRLMSAFGIVILVALGAIFSAHPSRIRWRHIFWGLALQYLFGLIILRWDVGQQTFLCLGDKISSFLAYSDQGSGFVFGYLVNQKPFNDGGLSNSSIAKDVVKDINAAKAINGVFFFKVLSVIYFFSFCVSMLFHIGAMQWIIGKIGWLLQVTVGTTACESLVAASNIFLGQTEAPLMIKPFIAQMTNSELHVVMTGGFATIAGGVLAAYISFNISAAHLLSASVMSAPAALAASKLLMPETKKTRTNADNMNVPKGNEVNLLDAASQGAITAVFLVANIAASLIAVLAFIAFINGILGWFGLLVGFPELTFQYILGKMFIPLSGIMGVEEKDMEAVGTLVGIKSFINEFAAYDAMRSMGDSISERSRVIATYALCGFSNPASIGIQIAAFSTLAPKRRTDFARLAFRAYIAGSMACFLTACVAGSLIREK